jgi:hypothetical protein
MCFGLMGPGHWWFGAMMQKRRQALARRLTSPART